MYFWKIDKLNEELISAELNESEGFKYLMANTILYSIGMIPYDEPNQFDVANGMINVIIGIIGLLFIYKCNGGSAGKQIIGRFLSVGWVIGIRFIALLLIPAVLVATIIQEVFMGGIPEETTIIDVFFMQISTIIYFLWVAKHINYIAKQTHQKV